MARVPKLSAEMQTKLCAVISVGCSLRAAARLMGCAESTVRTLARRDEAFAERLKQAELSREIIPLKNLQAAGVKYWRAAAWSLERLHPNEYGRRKPDVVTPQQLSAVTEQFAEILLRRISSLEDRRAVQQELVELMRRIERNLAPDDPRNRTTDRKCGPYYCDARTENGARTPGGHANPLNVVAEPAADRNEPGSSP